MEMVKRRVVARTEKRRIGPEETLVVTRTIDEKGDTKYDYYLSNASIDTSLEAFGRVAKAEHRIEECIKRSKSEAGLADYEVRSWLGWHHHQVLSMIATWFLVEETRRGKKATPALTVPQVRDAIALILHQELSPATPQRVARNKQRRLERNELARFYHWKQRNRLPPLRLNQRE